MDETEQVGKWNKQLEKEREKQIKLIWIKNRENIEC